MKKNKPYVPKEFPPKNIDWGYLISLISEANRKIGYFDGVLKSLVNPEVFLAPLITKEAVLSSRIEGTQATYEDVVKVEGGVITPDLTESKIEDVKEIINYRKALIHGEEELKRRPLSLSLVKEIHKILLSGVRGTNRLLGEFRRTQNWIGTRGTPIDNARFVPPDPVALPTYLSEWEAFLKRDDFQDRLVQAAILHAQFEILHPFEDGNGRTGRILIPLFLYWKNILSKPAFYMSEYFEENRSEYYDKLLYVTEKDDWNGWITFFLEAVIEQSRRNHVRATKLISLYNESKEKFIEATHSEHAIHALDAFFKKPILDTPAFTEMMKIPRRSAIALLNKLLEQKLITIYKQSKGSRPAVYAFCEVINIVEDRLVC